MWVRAVKKLHSRRDLGASALLRARAATHHEALRPRSAHYLGPRTHPARGTGTYRVILTTVYVSHNQPQIDSLGINNIFGYVIVSR